MDRRINGRMALAVMAAAAMSAATAQAVEPASGYAFGPFGSRGHQRRRGPGWSQAQVKRMAQKRRNVIRNRKAHR